MRVLAPYLTAPGLDPSQFLDKVIAPVLVELWMDSPSARTLLLGTALVESRLRYRLQIGGGPALGLFQMEPDTCMDIWINWLQYRPDIAIIVHGMRRTVSSQELVDELAWNDRYATAMARIHYRRVPKPLPAADDLEALAAYWKRYYNTTRGAGAETEFVRRLSVLGPVD